MSRSSKFLLPAALIAAIGAAGCFPIVSDQEAAQRDLIGDVSVSADVCTAPQLLEIIAGGIISGPNLRSAARSGDMRRLARGVSQPQDLLACPSEEELDDWLNDGTEVSAILGLPHQLLVAYRVPSGAEAPATFAARGTVAVADFWQQGQPRGGNEPVKETIDVAFKRAPEMDGQLGRLYEELWSGLDDAPKVTRPGTKLVGYISDQLPGPLVGDLNVAAGFGLPAGTVDQPYAGPFNALTMAGSRIALTSDQIGSTLRRSGAPRALRGAPATDFLDPDRPVDCLDDEIGGPARGGIPSDELLAVAICPMPTLFVSGSEDEIAEQLAEATEGVDLNTRDLRVLGGEGFAEQGATASVPFTLRGAGAASATELGLSAASTLAGAAITPAQSTTPFPGAGDHGRSVTVQVPENAAPGTYDVTLTASVGGQRRTGTGRVVVLPKPAAAASLAAHSRGRDNVYMDREGNIAFGWICPPACGDNQVDVTSPKAGIAPKANTAAVSKPRLLRIARSKFQAANAKRVRVKVRLFPRARKAVRKGRNVKAIIIVRTGGKGVPSVRRVTIKLRKPKR